MEIVFNRYSNKFSANLFFPMCFNSLFFIFFLYHHLYLIFAFYRIDYPQLVNIYIHDILNLSYLLHRYLKNTTISAFYIQNWIIKRVSAFIWINANQIFFIFIIILNHLWKSISLFSQNLDVLAFNLDLNVQILKIQIKTKLKTVKCIYMKK